MKSPDAAEATVREEGDIDAPQRRHIDHDGRGGIAVEQLAPIDLGDHTIQVRPIVQEPVELADVGDLLADLTVGVAPKADSQGFVTLQQGLPRGV